MPRTTWAVTGSEAADKLVALLASAVNTHDVEALRALYDEDYEGLDVSLESIQMGPGEVARDFVLLLGAFPDLRMDIVQIIGAASNSVGVFWTLSGMQSGQFLRVPPTERRVSVCGFSLMQHHNQKFVRGVHLWDLAGLFRRLRLLPELPDRILSESQVNLFAKALSMFN